MQRLAEGESDGLWLEFVLGEGVQHVLRQLRQLRAKRICLGT